MRKIICLLLCILVLSGCVQPESLETTIGDNYTKLDMTEIVVTDPQVSTVPTTKPTEPSTKPTDDVTVPSEPPKVPETEPPKTTEPKPPKEPEKTIEELVESGIYMLPRSLAFYKGSVPMSDIKTITFSKVKPKRYDERWNANLANTNDIVGYRIGLDVVIVGEYIYANRVCKYMFASYNKYGESLWSSLTSINGLELLNMSYATNISMMFYGGQFTSLTGIEQWDVGSVSKMSMVFARCTNLVSLDIGRWDVSKVQDFSGLFQGNDYIGDMQLQYLDVSCWDTSSALNMSHMFYGCGAMTYIPIENWNVSNVGSFSHMFADCFSLQNIDFSKWETTSVVSFDAFFNDCRSLTVIDVSGLDTATCRQFSQMFEHCVNLQNIIGIDTWDVSNASYYAFSETFHCCNSLQELNIGSWAASPDNTARMFKGCYELKIIDMSGFDMSNNLVVTEMFMNCKNLIEVVGMETWNFDGANGHDSVYTSSGLVG